MITHVPHLSSIANSLPPFEETTGIHLLIGRDAPELLKVRDFINGTVGAPWAQLMDLGWTVSGELCLDRHGGRVHVSSRRIHTGLQHGYVQCQNEIKCKEHLKVTRDDEKLIVSGSSTKKDQKEILSKIANNEFLTTEKGSEIGTSPEDRQFLECMKNSFHINKLGNWEAPLPFRNQNVMMPDNLVQAERRFKSLQKNFSKNPQLKKDYFEFMDKTLRRGHATRIPKSELITEPGKRWYLPHFAVYHPQKPTQVRIVFDSSAEHQGTSLNQELLQGPDLMNKLFGRLLRFRQHNVAIMCDIEQMFHSFYVNETHRDFLRFLWFKNDSPESSIVEYRMNVHLFGNGPSPAIAAYGLRKAAEDPSNKYGVTTRKFVNEDFYVDDGVYSCKSTEDAIILLKSAQEMLLDSKLRLHKVVSNYPDVMKAFPEHDLAKGLADLDLSKDKLPCQRTLGVQWDLDENVFTFKVINKDKPYTRRGILSVINSLYDPFGFLAPFTIVGKKILQNLIQLGKSKGDPLGWEDPLPADLETDWYKWHCGLSSLTEIRVQRCFHPQDFGHISKIEVHAFSDASKDALGAVLYLRLINTKGQIHVSFVKGSAKVKPQRHVSIPRMELCAAVLLVTTVKQTLAELEYDIDSTHYYTGSKIVLGYIMNESTRFYVYVANRVELIRSLASPTSWRYIESESNPADIATRGCSVSNLMNTLWLKCPEFLATGGDTPFDSFDLNQEDQEVRDVKACATRIHEKITSCSLCEYFKYFGSWTRLIKSISRLKILIRQKKSNVSSEIDSHALLEAEHVILKHVQQETFPSELKILVDQSSNAKRQLRGSRLYKLDPFVHEGLIRVGGRLR